MVHSMCTSFGLLQIVNSVTALTPMVSVFRDEADVGISRLMIIESGSMRVRVRVCVRVRLRVRVRVRYAYIHKTK